MPTLPADNTPSVATDTRSFKEITPDAAEIPSLPAGPRLPIPVDAKYIGARQYCDRFGGISFPTLARYIKSDKDFPRPVYFSRQARFFKLSDILAYEHLCEVRSAAKAMIHND